MKAYKGFNADLTCNGLQYKAGETMTHTGKVEPCTAGLHACTNPIDVLHYYHPSSNSRYFEVECNKDIKRHHVDSKLACSELTPIAELGLIDLIKIGIAMIIGRNSKTKPDKATSGDRSTAIAEGGQSTADTSGYQSTAATSGYQSTAATSGDRSTAATSGDRSTAATSGDQSTAATSGDRSTAATSGDRSTAATSGDQSTAATSGDQSTAATSGYQSTAATSGDRSTAATSGDRSTAIAEGKYSIAVANGYGVNGKGKIGGHIILTEYSEQGVQLHVKCRKVDGRRIKEDTLYTLKEGKFVIWQEDGL